jgi:putative phage-type endonuclease
MTSLETLPHILGDAKFIARFENNSPEWLELRSRGIGGSDVATISGLNKWESAATLWYKKSGLIDSVKEDNGAMEWGRRLEAPILEKFIEDNPQLEVYTDCGTWVNKDREYQIVNPDGLFKDENGDWGIIEIKTARFADDWAAGVPVYYLTQVQYYLNAFGFKRAFVAVLISGSDYRVFEVQASPLQQSVDLENVERFIASVESKTKPDWDGSDSTYETVRKLHPQIEDDEIEIGELADVYALTKLAADEAANALQLVKTQILDMMGNSKKATSRGKWVFSRQAKGQGVPYLVEKRG